MNKHLITILLSITTSSFAGGFSSIEVTHSEGKRPSGQEINNQYSLSTGYRFSGKDLDQEAEVSIPVSSQGVVNARIANTDITALTYRLKHKRSGLFTQVGYVKLDKFDEDFDTEGLSNDKGFAYGIGYFKPIKGNNAVSFNSTVTRLAKVSRRSVAVRITHYFE